MVVEKLALVTGQIKDIMEKVKNSGVGAQSAAADIIAIRLDAKLANMERLLNKAVMVHPENRFKAGLDICDVHALMDLICKRGWNWTEVKQPTCFDIPPGDAGEECIQFNDNLVKGSGGYLDPLAIHEFSESNVGDLQPHNCCVEVCGDWC